MTRKVYKSAMGKTVDMGALMLQNEQTRAVGNMNVNARGDLLNSANRVVEPRNRQAQRKYRKQTMASGNIPVDASTVSARNQLQQSEAAPEDAFADLPEDDLELDPISFLNDPAPESQPTDQPRGGLAAAIARSREVKQELEKTRRQQLQSQGIKKI